MNLSTKDAALLTELVVCKAHGAGNDFVVVVDPDDRAMDMAPETVRALCDRHLGIGADGLIRVGGPPEPGSLGEVDVTGAQVTMDYRNGDGSIAQMCGNGIRVTARLALELGMVPPAATVAVATRSGVRRVEVEVHDGVFVAATVDMGPAAFDAPLVGLDPDVLDGTITDFRLDDLPHSWAGLSMGNPHVVTIVDDVACVDLDTLGPQVETHEAFGDGVNVNVVQVVDDTSIRLRTWERGVGATMACGSGACATVAAMAEAGHLAPDADVTVRVPGGALVIRQDARGHLLLSGPAVVVARVDLAPDWFAGDGGRG